MKTERVFVLRFNNGARIPYGVPEFMSEEEAADFVAHVSSELMEGAAQYFEQCCKSTKVQASGSTEDDGAESGQPYGSSKIRRVLTFSHHPSAETKRLEERVNQLRRLGQSSLQLRAQQREAERQQIESDRRQALKMQQPRPGRGYAR